MSAMVSAEDRGFLLGDGVFDTLAVHDGIPVFLSAHITPLVRHAGSIGIAVEPGLIGVAIEKSIRDFNGQDCLLRTTLTHGVAARGMWTDSVGAPTIKCLVSPLDRALIGAPTAIIVNSFARNETSPLSRIKSLGCLDHIIAAREARLAGADDALFLNTKGALTCNTIGNVFILEGSNLITPPLSDGVLDGIIRGALIENPPLGLTLMEQTLMRGRAMAAYAVMITNSIRLARPVTRLGDRTFENHAINGTVLSHLLKLVETDLPMKIQSGNGGQI